jgi:hypothetical protein
LNYDFPLPVISDNRRRHVVAQGVFSGLKARNERAGEFGQANWGKLLRLAPVVFLIVMIILYDT